jgi:hypothetical protein
VCRNRRWRRGPDSLPFGFQEPFQRCVAMRKSLGRLEATRGSVNRSWDSDFLVSITTAI